MRSQRRGRRGVPLRRKEKETTECQWNVQNGRDEFNNTNRVFRNRCVGAWIRLALPVGHTARTSLLLFSSFRDGMQHSIPKRPPPPPPVCDTPTRPSTPAPLRLKLEGWLPVPYTGATRPSLVVTCLITGSPSLLFPRVPDVPVPSSSSSAFVHIVRPPCLVGDPGVRETPSGYPSGASSSTPTRSKRAEGFCFCGVVSLIALALPNTRVRPSRPREGF